MHKTLSMLWICPALFFLLIGHVKILDAFKTNPVKCHDSKNFPTCYNNNNLYCPSECAWSCMVDCAKCKAVCISPPTPKLSNSKSSVDCQDKKNFTQPPHSSFKGYPVPIPNPIPRNKQINFPPHASFQGYSTPPAISINTPSRSQSQPQPQPNKQINLPPHTSFKGYLTPVPDHHYMMGKGYNTPSRSQPPHNKQINFPPSKTFKGYSTPPVPAVPVNTPSPTKTESTESPALSSSKASSTPRTARCRNKNYPKCYSTQHKCPPACPDHCEVDCAKCSPVCSCNYPGSVCKDPKFVGADGLTFYFHGKKNQDFCIVSDHNLHINAHFIGIRNHHMTRDFTWIQAIGIRFGSHNISIAALRTSTWDDALDRLYISFDGQSPKESQLDEWGWPEIDPKVVFRRRTNAVVIEAKDLFQIKANVVPITKRESMVHGYGIDTEKDCFSHLDLSFKFYSLSEVVDGVLGQTYASNYVSRVKMGVAMPVLGGNDKFFSSSIFATDCVASRFMS